MRFSFAFLTPFIFFLAPAFALQIPARPQGYVSDYAGVLSSEARARLEEKLRQFENETSNQIVVTIFPSLEGEVLEDFSIRLAEAWKIGQKGKDNGVILLIFKNEKKVRIEVGYGLEGAVPDALAKLIIQNEMVPQFRQGNFDGGVEKAAEALMAATKGEYNGSPSSSIRDSMGPVLILGIFFGAFLPLPVLQPIFMFGILFFVSGLIQSSLAKIFYAFTLGVIPLPLYYLFGRHLRGPSLMNRRGYHSRDSGIFGGGGFGDGGFGGGGFSGGGGSFGGGGASGGW